MIKKKDYTDFAYIQIPQSIDVVCSVCGTNLKIAVQSSSSGSVTFEAQPCEDCAKYAKEQAENTD